jgi:hypothetical protein
VSSHDLNAIVRAACLALLAALLCGGAGCRPTPGGRGSRKVLVRCDLQYPDGTPVKADPRRRFSGGQIDVNIGVAFRPSGGGWSHGGPAPDDGVFVIRRDIVHRGETECSIVLAMRGYRRCEPVQVSLGEDGSARPSRAVLRLRAGVQIQITTLDDAGQPLPGVGMALHWGGYYWPERVTSDAAGHITLDRMDPESCDGVEVSFDHPGSAPNSRRFSAAELLRPVQVVMTKSVAAKVDQAAPRRVRLPPLDGLIPDGVARFTVLDLVSGRPLAERTLYVGNCTAGASAKEIWTDAEGRFTYTAGLCSGVNVFYLAADGYGRRGGGETAYGFYQPVFVGLGQRQVDTVVRLRPGKTIRVHVTGRSGMPLARSPVLLERYPNQNQTRRIALRGETDWRGNLTLDDVACVALRSPWPDSAGRIRVPVADLEPGQTLRLRVPAEPLSTMVKGRFLLPGGEPLVNGEVYYSIKSLADRSGVPAVPYACSSTLLTDSRGRFRLFLPDGRYALRIYDRYCAKPGLVLDVRHGSDAELAVDLRPLVPQRIEVTVLDDAQRPLPGVYVESAVPTGADGRVCFDVDASAWDAPRQGRFVAYRRSPGPGDQLLVAEIAALIPCGLGSGSGADVALRVVLPARAALRFRASGVAPSGWVAALLEPVSTDLPFSANSLANLPVAADGEVRWDGLAPGTYWLKVGNDQDLVRVFPTHPRHADRYKSDCQFLRVSPAARMAVLRVELEPGAALDLGEMKLGALTLITGRLSGHRQRQNALPGSEWQDSEESECQEPWSFCAGSVGLTPTGGSAGALPEIAVPVLVGGFLSAWVLPGDYLVTNRPLGGNPPEALGVFSLAPGASVDVTPQTGAGAPRQ